MYARNWVKLTPFLHLAARVAKWSKNYMRAWELTCGGSTFAKPSAITGSVFIITARVKTRGSMGCLDQTPLSEWARAREQAGVVELLCKGMLWFFHFCPPSLYQSLVFMLLSFISKCNFSGLWNKWIISPVMSLASYLSAAYSHQHLDQVLCRVNLPPGLFLLILHSKDIAVNLVKV